MLVKAALDGAAVSAVRTTGAEHAVDITTDAGPVTLVVDDAHRPLRITSPGAHPNLGDITLTTRFTDHGPAGALTLPGTFATQVDDFTTAEYRVTSTVAGDGTVAAPDALRAAAVPAPAAPTVTSDEVAPGVWLLAGGLVALVAADVVLARADAAGAVLAGAALWGLHMGLTQGLFAALVAGAAPADLRGTAFGVFNFVGGVALLVASVLAGWLWDAYGPAYTFGAGAVFTALAGLGLVLRRRDVAALNRPG